jgi:putative peptidoglycan lipid II flippase
MRFVPTTFDGRLVTRVLAATGVAALLVGLVLAIAWPLGEAGDSAAPARATPAQAKPTPEQKPPAARALSLTAVGALDPEGDGRESDELAPLAVDGDAATAWRTERYSNFFKEGVGLVLDAGRTVTITRVDVSTGTPGYIAEVRAGPTPSGPFRTISPSRTVNGQTAFPGRGRKGRYVVVWITGLPDGTAADVAEVRLRGR